MPEISIPAAAVVSGAGDVAVGEGVAGAAGSSGGLGGLFSSLMGGGGSSILGGLFGGAGSFLGAQATNAANMGLNKQTEDWMTMMSDTAMQRRVADLKAAGLNPLLAVGQGGAMVPGFSPIPMQNTLGNAANQLGSGISNAPQAQALSSLTQSQKGLTDAQADKTRSDAISASANAATSAQTAADNLDILNSKMYAARFEPQAMALETKLKNEDFMQAMKTTDFQQQFLEFRNQLQEIDYLRASMGMQKLENDQAWQIAHPQLSGWLQSGAVDAGISGAKSLLSAPGQLLRSLFGGK